MTIGALHVFPPSGDLAKPMSSRRRPGWQIQAAYTSWRQAASSTSASLGAQELPLMSVTGPTARPDGLVPPWGLAALGGEPGEQAAPAAARVSAAAMTRRGTLMT
jgi:hypothetical protein